MLLRQKNSKSEVERGGTGVTHGKTALGALLVILSVCASPYCLFQVGAMQAAEEVVVRVAASPENSWLSEKVLLKVDVLARDGWAQLKTTETTEIDGGFLRRFETQGTRLNEQIDGESYTGQRYELFFFPQQSGSVELPPMDLGIEIKSWGNGGQTERKKVRTPSVNLQVRSPPGGVPAEGLISTTSFSARQSWQPQAEGVAVGDAITRTIVLEAADQLAMAFAPLDQEALNGDLSGVGIYQSEPDVADLYSRGELIGQRTERVTYIMEQAGRVNLPALHFSWWNTKSERYETTVLAGKTLDVRGAPAGEVNAQIRIVKERDSRILQIVLILAVAVVVSGWWQRKRLAELISSLQSRWQQSEYRLFSEVREAAMDGEVGLFLRAVVRWLDSGCEDHLPARLDLFFDTYGEPEDQAALAEIYGLESSSMQPERVTALFTALARARKKWLRTRRRKRKAEKLLPRVEL